MKEDMETPEPQAGGFSLKDIDLVGLGKVAKAIPPEVYKQTTKTALKTFESVVAPLTQFTDGFGRLIRQKFDNWLETQKAIGAYTLEQAVNRAKAQMQGEPLKPPAHPKSFLRALEESSLETDSLLHEMWVNLLASQLVERNNHPHFVGILSELGPEEARLLAALKPYRKHPRLVENFFGPTYANLGGKSHWVTDPDQPNSQPRSMSVTILCQHNLANTSVLKSQQGQPPCEWLHLTPFGVEFMAVIAPP